ncbi:MAG: molecular chaperone TorD family protein [Alkalispirochaeta sp.]
MAERGEEEVAAEVNLVSRRVTAYRLLADCFYPPDKNLLEKLRGAGEWNEARFSSLVQCFEREEGIESLAVDAAKLFIGPFELLAPPYGSVYLDNSRVVMGESTIDAEKLYINEGLNLELKETPDHITVELEFLSYLNFRQLEALKAADMESADGYRNKQQAFLNDHLGRWVFQFTKKVKDFSRTEFYKSVAVLTDEFIKEDIG